MINKFVYYFIVRQSITHAINANGIAIRIAPMMAPMVLAVVDASACLFLSASVGKAATNEPSKHIAEITIMGTPILLVAGLKLFPDATDGIGLIKSEFKLKMGNFGLRVCQRLNESNCFPFELGSVSLENDRKERDPKNGVGENRNCEVVAKLCGRRNRCAT